MSKEVVEANTDRFRFEDFNRSELAIDVISTMLGFNMKDSMAEEEKEDPDPERLKLLEEEEVKLLGERDRIYSGDKEVMQSCIDRYAPLIRARYARYKKN